MTWGIQPAAGCGAVLGVVPVLVSPLLPILGGVAVAVATALVSLLKPSVMKQTLRLVWRLKLPLVIVLACGTGVVWGAHAVWPYLGPAAGAAEGSESDWPMVRGGPARRGAPPGAQGPTRGGVHWAWEPGGPAFYASPAVVGNRVYMVSARLGFLGGSGEIFCLDADTGARVWQSAPDGYRATFSSPVIAGNRLVCGEGLHFTRDARVVCLDLTPGSEGKVLWTHPTKSHVECTPVVCDGRVYVGAGDDGYYCLELEPAPDGTARVVWHVPGEEYPDAETGLAVADGKVYAGLGLGGKALCVLDAATGKELRRIPTPYPVFSPPSIADGKLYLGMGNGDYVNTAEKARDKVLEKMRDEGKSAEEVEAARQSLGPAGEVWCFDLATLEVDWKFDVGQTVLGAVAVAGDHLYFGSRGGRVYCLGRDGKPVTTFDAHAPILTAPAVTDAHVYVIADSGTLYGLRRETLEPVWELPVGTEPSFISSPTAARGRVYVGTQADGFLCAGDPGDAKRTPLWAGHLGGPGKAGNPDDSPLPPRGAMLWQYPADQAGKTADAYVTAPPAAIEGYLFVPLAAGPKPGVACLPTGGSGARTPEPAWVFEVAGGVHRSPAVSGDNVLFVDGRPGGSGRKLHCVDAPGGTARWQTPVADDASGVLAATAQHVFVQDADDALTCLDLKGGRVWSAAVGRMDHAATATDSMVVAATTSPPALVALDGPTGRRLWQVALEARCAASPAVADSVVYLGTARGLEARSLVDGAPVPGWSVACGPVSGDFALGREIVAYINTQGELVLANRGDGRILSRIGGATPGTSPLLSRRTVLYLAKEGLMQLAAGDAEAQPAAWTDLSSLGRPTSPMVVAGRQIYVGMAGWGLVCLGAAP